MYIHVPIFTGIGAVSAGILNAIAHPHAPLEHGVLWILSGGVALALVSIGVMFQSLEYRKTFRLHYKIGNILMYVCGLCALAVGVFGETFSPSVTMGSLLALVFTPIIYGICAWLFMAPSESTESR
jgi:low temperature requirement protein LtrA